jgi:hypothetical protein
MGIQGWKSLGSGPKLDYERFILDDKQDIDKCRVMSIFIAIAAEFPCIQTTYKIEQ